MLHYLHIGLRITITQSHTHTMQQTHTHKAVTRRVEAKKLLSRQRQSEYSATIVFSNKQYLKRGRQPFFSATTTLWVLSGSITCVGHYAPDYAQDAIHHAILCNRLSRHLVGTLMSHYTPIHLVKSVENYALCMRLCLSCSSNMNVTHSALAFTHANRTDASVKH